MMVSSVAQGMRQIPLDLGPVSLPGLDDFLPDGNGQLLDWLRRWPQGGDESSTGRLPSAYLWGAAGAGKTHLLRAMVPRALAMGYGVIWISGQGCQMWDADDPMAPSLALMDDCEQLDEQMQHLAFNLFIEWAAGSGGGAQGGGVSIIAAGHVPPVDLPVRDDLRTRLGWGQIFAVSALGEDGVRTVLQAEAQRRGMALADGVVSYLLSHYSRDLAFLMGLLDRLDRFALAEHRTVTVPLLKQMLALENP
ncbi:DnaA regulatory inactivator Hda [Aquabacterium sp.]|uniref:HdaA/DnaA family protein n=1 Tax=Aquabacterium sp. TaxID=1872578 RepID=UPI0035B350AE